MVLDLDARYCKGYRLSHNTFLKVQTQETTAKKPCTEESKPKEAKLANDKTPAPPRSDEPAKFYYKNKKREWLKKKKNSTLAIEDNTIEDKKKRTSGDTNQVTCYNCQKKDHFANKYTKLKN